MTYTGYEIARGSRPSKGENRSLASFNSGNARRTQKLRVIPKNAWPTPSVFSATSGLSLMSSGST